MAPSGIRITETRKAKKKSKSPSTFNTSRPVYQDIQEAQLNSRIKQRIFEICRHHQELPNESNRWSNRHRLVNNCLVCQNITRSNYLDLDSEPHQRGSNTVVVKPKPSFLGRVRCNGYKLDSNSEETRKTRWQPTHTTHYTIFHLACNYQWLTHNSARAVDLPSRLTKKVLIRTTNSVPPQWAYSGFHSEDTNSRTSTRPW